MSKVMYPFSYIFGYVRSSRQSICDLNCDFNGCSDVERECEVLHLLRVILVKQADVNARTGTAYVNQE